MSTTSRPQGRGDIVTKVFAEIQKVFGEMKINWYDFTNCGVKHVQCQRTYIVTLDQIHYANTLRTIVHPQVKEGKPEDAADASLHKLYMSLLGAVAYLSHTRLDVSVFVCALQRRLASPKVEHIRKLNRLLRWIQRNPKKITYLAPTKPTDTHLRVVSDAAFKREQEDGYSLRGALFLRCAGSCDPYKHDTACFALPNMFAHPLEWACRSQKHVTRSTFAAELLSVGE